MVEVSLGGSRIILYIKIAHYDTTITLSLNDLTVGQIYKAS